MDSKRQPSVKQEKPTFLNSPAGKLIKTLLDAIHVAQKELDKIAHPTPTEKHELKEFLKYLEDTVSRVISMLSHFDNQNIPWLLTFVDIVLDGFKIYKQFDIKRPLFEDSRIIGHPIISRLAAAVLPTIKEFPPTLKEFMPFLNPQALHAVESVLDYDMTKKALDLDNSPSFEQHSEGITNTERPYRYLFCENENLPDEMLILAVAEPTPEVIASLRGDVELISISDVVTEENLAELEFKSNAAYVRCKMFLSNDIITERLYYIDHHFKTYALLEMSQEELQELDQELKLETDSRKKLTTDQLKKIMTVTPYHLRSFDLPFLLTWDKKFWFYANGKEGKWSFTAANSDVCQCLPFTPGKMVFLKTKNLPTKLLVAVTPPKTKTLDDAMMTSIRGNCEIVCLPNIVRERDVEKLTFESNAAYIRCRMILSDEKAEETVVTEQLYYRDKPLKTFQRFQDLDDEALHAFDKALELTTKTRRILLPIDLRMIDRRTPPHDRSVDNHWPILLKHEKEFSLYEYDSKSQRGEFTPVNALVCKKISFPAVNKMAMLDYTDSQSPPLFPVFQEIHAKKIHNYVPIIIDADAHYEGFGQSLMHYLQDFRSMSNSPHQTILEQINTWLKSFIKPDDQAIIEDEFKQMPDFMPHNLMVVPNEFHLDKHLLSTISCTSFIRHRDGIYLYDCDSQRLHEMKMSVSLQAFDEQFKTKNTSQPNPMISITLPLDKPLTSELLEKYSTLAPPYRIYPMKTQFTQDYKSIGDIPDYKKLETAGLLSFKSTPFYLRFLLGKGKKKDTLIYRVFSRQKEPIEGEISLTDLKQQLKEKYSNFAPLLANFPIPNKSMPNQFNRQFSPYLADFIEIAAKRGHVSPLQKPVIVRQIDEGPDPHPDSTIISVFDYSPEEKTWRVKKLGLHELPEKMTAPSYQGLFVYGVDEAVRREIALCGAHRENLPSLKETTPNIAYRRLADSEINELQQMMQFSAKTNKPFDLIYRWYEAYLNVFSQNNITLLYQPFLKNPQGWLEKVKKMNHSQRQVEMKAVAAPDAPLQATITKGNDAKEEVKAAPASSLPAEIFLAVPATEAVNILDANMEKKQEATLSESAYEQSSASYCTDDDVDKMFAEIHAALAEEQRSQESPSSQTEKATSLSSDLTPSLLPQVRKELSEEDFTRLMKENENRPTLIETTPQEASSPAQIELNEAKRGEEKASSSNGISGSSATLVLKTPHFPSTMGLSKQLNFKQETNFHGKNSNGFFSGTFGGFCCGYGLISSVVIYALASAVASALTLGIAIGLILFGTAIILTLRARHLEKRPLITAKSSSPSSFTQGRCTSRMWRALGCTRQQLMCVTAQSDATVAEQTSLAKDRQENLPREEIREEAYSSANFRRIKT